MNPGVSRLISILYSETLCLPSKRNRQELLDRSGLRIFFQTASCRNCRKELSMEKKNSMEEKRSMEKNYSREEKELHVVRNHKDTVFRLLYQNREKLLELYNALNGTAYEDSGAVEICTLENAIYMEVKNDVSFLFDSQMNLYEHQSSFNPNMPLRDLFYIARQLEKYTLGKSLYSSKLRKIPVPRFVVFYNGTQEQPESRILKLSDAFEKQVPSPELEVKVTMLNINLGKNRELMEKCRTLREYCMFVERIRGYAKELEIAEAVERAVTECIREDILADFLSAQRAEVIAMSIFEYNKEEEMKKIRADEFRIGKDAGKAEGKAEDVLALLKELGEIPVGLRERILSETDLELLNRWLKQAAKAGTIQEFIEKAGLPDIF